MNCDHCHERIRSPRFRRFPELSNDKYLVCRSCGKAQRRQILLRPAPSKRGIAADAMMMFERWLTAAERIRLRVLVWGPSTSTRTSASEKRLEIRDALEQEGH